MATALLGQALLVAPFCTGRGSISNAGKWVGWRDKDYFKGLIPGFVGYPAAKSYDADIAAMGQRIAALEARTPVPGPSGPQGPQGIPGPQGPTGPSGSSGGGADGLRDLLRAWLGIQ